MTNPALMCMNAAERFCRDGTFSWMSGQCTDVEVSLKATGYPSASASCQWLQSRDEYPIQIALTSCSVVWGWSHAVGACRNAALDCRWRARFASLRHAMFCILVA